MKYTFTFLLFAALSGCASSQAVVPELEGKSRVQINKTPAAKAVLAAPQNSVQGE